PGATPAPAPLIGAGKAKEEPRPQAESPTEKAFGQKKDGDGLAKADSDLKTRKGVTGEPLAEAAPTHLTLASTQLAKARPQMEEALKQMGVKLPQPPAPTKTMAKSAPRETEATVMLELMDVQIARVRQELERPGRSRLLAGRP